MQIIQLLPNQDQINQANIVDVRTPMKNTTENTYLWNPWDP